jgi:hypothetical protein
VAKRKIYLVIDDLDGKPVLTEIQFCVDGTMYTIDLGCENAKRLRAAFSPFIAAAREVKRSPRATTQSAAQRKQSAAIREWAIKKASRLEPAAASRKKSTPRIVRPTPPTADSSN